MTETSPRTVAAVITEWRTNSHADVILGRLVEPEAWGHARPFNLRLASVYADQFPENDLCRATCARHGIPVAATIDEAVGAGVDGVLLIGEHGRYARNARGQTLYPRRRLFEAVVNAFRARGRRVPVFIDKHLSYEWLFARWMYDLARHEGVPLLAGSSLPVAWRVPEVDLPRDEVVNRALGVGYSDLDAYGFHAIETLQCMVERRRGGETGVRAVRCLSGPAAWGPEGLGGPDGDLLKDLMPARLRAEPKARPAEPRPGDVVFQLEYVDGLRASVAMLDSVGECFAFSGRVAGRAEPVATVFDLEPVRPFGHFGHLLRAVERMVETGVPPYPIERTLLTTGVLAALLESHAEGGSRIATPQLAAIRYTPADWPFAAGPRGTPA